MTITMELARGGHVRIMPAGYEGSTCNEATRPYTTRLGGEQVRQEGEAEEVKVTQGAAASQQQKASQ